MQLVSRVSVLLAVMSLLPACGKSVEPEAAKPSGEVVQTQQQEAFGLTGELLTVNVDGMAQSAFLAKLGQLTGSQILSEGNASAPVTVHVEQASLRKVLSLAIADAPYSVTMQYTNLQDSFPVSVTISHYGSAVAAGVNGTQPMAVQRPDQAGAMQTAETPTESVDTEQEPPAVDLQSMPEEEKISYFLGQREDDQVSLIFDMEPTPEDAAMMAKLLTRIEVTKDVKIEMLDSLSNGEYVDSIPALKIAVESTDPEIATRAVEVITELGDERDVPLLKKIAEGSADQSVRDAAKDAIESLE